MASWHKLIVKAGTGISIGVGLFDWIVIERYYYIDDSEHGGELDSTGVKRQQRHVELSATRKNRGIKHNC